MNIKVAILTAMLVLSNIDIVAAQEKPADLETGQAPEAAGFEFDGSYRLRFESINNSFRRGDDSDQLAVSRLLAQLRYNGEHGFAGAELQDSRAWGGDSATPLGTDDINTLAPLQYYLGWQGRWQGGDLEVRAGRLTADMGSRRLLARNHFRNTLNNFEGVSLNWQAGGENATQWQAFWFNPVQRDPEDRTALEGNDYGVDRALRGTRLWGLYRESESLALYAIRLDESDEYLHQNRINTRDRDFTTLGIFRDKAATVGNWGFELEAAWQFGYSRSTTAVSAPLLDHRAGFAHADWRYQFGDALKSQLRLQLDYATGDRSAGDGENNRFDTLYGARRFEFGPTGIWGAFARTNILSPGLRWQFQSVDWFPETAVHGVVGYRAIWRASAADGHASAGISADNGERFVGHQFEARLQAPLAQNVESEIGAAYLTKGPALEDASDTSAPASYLYYQVTVNF